MKKFLLVGLGVVLAGCASPEKQLSYIQQGEQLLSQGDLVNAENKFRLAYQNGDNAGLVGLGVIENRKGNLQKEEYYYLQAYNRGFTFAGFRLSQFYIKTLNPRDCQTGLNYLIEAAFKGDRVSLEHLINNYGTTVSKYFDYRRDHHLDVIMSGAMYRAMAEKWGEQKAANQQQATMNKLLHKCQSMDWNL